MFIHHHEKRAAIDVALQTSVRPALVQRLYQIRADIDRGGAAAAVQLLRTARTNNDTLTAWLVVRSSQLISDPAIADAIDQEALQLFELEEIFDGKRRAKLKPDDLDDEAARRVICAGLLLAVKDAQRGDTEARSWIESEHARAVAGWIDLDDYWPPTLAQIARSKVARSGMTFEAT